MNEMIPARETCSSAIVASLQKGDTAMIGSRAFTPLYSLPGEFVGQLEDGKPAVVRWNSTGYVQMFYAKEICNANPSFMHETPMYEVKQPLNPQTVLQEPAARLA